MPRAEYLIQIRTTAESVREFLKTALERTDENAEWVELDVEAATQALDALAQGIEELRAHKSEDPSFYDTAWNILEYVSGSINLQQQFADAHAGRTRSSLRQLTKLIRIIEAI